MWKKSALGGRALWLVALLLAAWVPLSAWVGPGWGLMDASAALLALWLLYLLHFAFVGPWALALEVAAFSFVDWLCKPEAGAMVFAGSSTIAHWRSLKEDMAPLVVRNRGINGARLHQLLPYARRLLLSASPKALVLYAGENDIAGFLGLGRRTAQQVLKDFRALVAIVHRQQPALQLYYLGMKPPRRRAWARLEFEACNRLVEAECATDGRLHYLDTGAVLRGPDGEVRPDIFLWDGLHLNAVGYALLSQLVRPALLRLAPP